MPLAEGQAIMPEVMEGIRRQTMKACIIPITSPREKNHYTGNLKNWIKALGMSNGIFIGMDSDVVINDIDALSKLLDIPPDVEFAGVATQPEHYSTTQENMNLAHSLLYCKNPQGALKLFKTYLKEKPACCWCKYIEYIMNNKKKYRLYKFPNISECERIEMVGTKEIKYKHMGGN